MNEKYSQAGSTAWRPPPHPAPRPGSWRPPGPRSSGPPPPTLATQLNNGDIAGRAAAPRPPLPLTRAYPWAYGWPGAGSGAAGCGRASSPDGGRAAGSTPLRAPQPERASSPGSTARKGNGEEGCGGGGVDGGGLRRPRPQTDTPTVPPTRTCSRGKLGRARVAPCGRPRCSIPGD